MTSHLFFFWSHLTSHTPLKRKTTPCELLANSLRTRTCSESETFEWLIDSSVPCHAMPCRTTSSTTTTTERSVTTCSRRLPIPILRLPHPTPIGPQPHQLSAEWKDWRKGRKEAGKFVFNAPQDYYSNNGQIHTYQLLKRRKKWAERERETGLAVGSCNAFVVLQSPLQHCSSWASSSLHQGYIVIATVLLGVL